MPSVLPLLLSAAVLTSADSVTPALPSGPGPHDPHKSSAADRGLPKAELTLDLAIMRALEMSPSLAAGTYAVSAAKARVTQAGLLPNPEIELESENFGGGGDLDGFNAAESTAVISQPILMGGKRSRRRAVAEAEQTLAGRELQALRLDVLASTTSAFYRVLGAQERVALADELLGLADRFARTVQARVDAGKVSPIEASRASIEVAQARVGLARAKHELEAPRVLLAATWGSSAANFDRAAGELPEPTDQPSPGQLRQHLTEAPEVARLEDQIEREKRILELEKSLRIPDLTVRVGPRRFEETGQSAWVAGFSLPIPIFDRNQGSRRAAEFDLDRTRRDVEAVRVGLEAELASALERLRGVAVEATTLSQEIVPAANAAFAATETGYRKGKLGFLNVLDAQRALFETRSLLLDSREDYATIRTEIERLIGRPLSPLAGTPTPRHDTSQGAER